MRSKGNYPISHSNCASETQSMRFLRRRVGQPRDGSIWILVEARCIRRSHVGKIKWCNRRQVVIATGVGGKAGVASMSMEVAVRLQSVRLAIFN